MCQECFIQFLIAQLKEITNIWVDEILNLLNAALTSGQLLMFKIKPFEDRLSNIYSSSKYRLKIYLMNGYKTNTTFLSLTILTLSVRSLLYLVFLFGRESTSCRVRRNLRSIYLNMNILKIRKWSQRHKLICPNSHTKSAV